MRIIAFYILFAGFLISRPVNACTTFLISGKYTSDGKSILFKNRDTDEMNNSLLCFSDGKYKYIGLVDGNKTWDKMVWGGYNETGFAIINSAAYNNNIGDTSKYMDQEGIVMKMALQNCRTIEDFENMLKNLPKPLGVDANFGVIDANGGAAYYETGNFKFVKYDANDPKIAPNGLLIRTNHSYSADLKKGFGFCRYNTASLALNRAIEQKDLSAKNLLGNLSRNLYHSLTNTDLSKNIPKTREIPEFRFFIDYIPRESTASAILIIGAKNSKTAYETMAWTILGFPLTSVAIPVWITKTTKLPKSVSFNSELKSPVCEAALAFKKECFPITHDRGYNYINLSAILNEKNTGYLQVLQNIESEIFKRGCAISETLKLNSDFDKIIDDFYKWTDDYLSKSYFELFNYRLFTE